MTVPLHGGQLPQIAARFNIPIEHLIDFSANINPEGPPPSVAERIRAALGDPATLTKYPDLQSTALRAAIATYANAPPETIAVANGFVPLLEAAINALNIKNCLLPVPAFNEYRRTFERNRVHVEPYALDPQSNFTYDPETLIARARASNHDALLLANPQNPTGVLTPLSSMTHLVHRAQQSNIRLLVDEAFMDYTPHESLIPLVKQHPNLIVFRSVTKFHGIPGLRAAYCVAHPATRERIARAIPPWSITTLAEVGVIAALVDHVYARSTIALNATRRDSLTSALEDLGITIVPSQANYLLMALPTDSPEKLWARMITKHRIVLRLCTNFEALPPQYFRAAIRNEHDNALLTEALADILRIPS